MIKQAFILAAGYGTRMQPITSRVPKPIIEVNGQSIITRTLDQLLEYGIQHVVINAFYKKELLTNHIEEYINKASNPPKIELIEETELLETGGGIVNVLPHFKNEPFFVVNSDSIFVGQNVFSVLNNSWNKSMNSLFLLNKLDKSHGYDGKGDFNLDDEKQIVRNIDNKYAFSGVHITKPELFKNLKIAPMKLMDIYYKYKKNDTLQGFYGEIYSGTWYHVGTPQSLEETNKQLNIIEKDSANN